MSHPDPFGDCKMAVLQNAAFIQDDGGLIGIDVHAQLITACSQNLLYWIGKTPEDTLGQAGVQIFGKQWPQLARLAAQEGRHQVAEISIAGVKDPRTVIAHRRGDHLLLELKAPSARQPNWWNHAARAAFLESLSASRTVDQCIALLVDEVAKNTSVDRVLAYRFLPGWHGEVIYESCRPGIDGFMGLRFPASDLPANARHLYTLNWQRVIADVEQKSVPLTYWSEDSLPLDLTYSMLRAVHPVHIQYLRNMGVQASLSLSLVVNGKLWGLVACHHMTPVQLSVHERFALEEMAKLVALHLKNLLGLIDQERHSTLRENMSGVRGSLQALGDNPANGLCLVLGRIRELFGADGAWLHFDGNDHFVGMTPDTQALPPLHDWLELLPKDETSQLSSLPEPLQRHPALVRHASGLLFIPLGTSDHLVLMRQEVVHVVHWAGQPASQDDSDAKSLTPRNSFSTWAQQVRNTAEPWQDAETACAEALRKELIDFVNFARLEQIALRDPLTGLANRMQFDKRLQQEVAQALSRNSQFAVHMIDLDKFKPVNDNLGHAAGDALLQAVSQRLMELVRVQDTVARLGGDEFAVIQSAVASREAAATMADRIVREVAKPYLIMDTAVEIGASVGVALFPSDSADKGELLHQADIALYAVKRAGRNAFSLFEPAMRGVDDGKLEPSALTTAIEQKQLMLFYQPVTDARNGELRGLESFVRWQHPEKGLLAAEAFLTQLEQSHLGATLGHWVLDSAFAQQKQWQSMGLTTVPLTVNISSSQFASMDLVAEINRLSVLHDLGFEWLRLDIKEDAILRDVNQAVRKLAKLREIGVAAQLDNFGRGFISLGFMTRVPFLAVKFDATALGRVGEPGLSTAVLSVVKGIAKVLNAKLGITRVETAEQLEWLRRNEVDLLQGFAVGQPMSAVEAVQWLGKFV